MERITEAGCEPHLVSLRRDSLRPVQPSLAPVQRVLFRQALALGFFEVPRRITLTRLADNVLEVSHRFRQPSPLSSESWPNSR
jgi:hypothetical protein